MSSFPPTFVPGFHDEVLVKKMKYNRLGKTDLIVSELSIGGGTLSSFYGKVDEEEAIKTIQAAIRSGINYIDTAPWYGQGQSEQIIGKALKDVPRQAYYIATKVGRYELELSKQFNFTSDKTNESIDTSLSYLGLDYVDLIQIHDVEFAKTTDLIVNETIPALEEAVATGKARYIGITGYPLNVLKEVILKAPGRVHAILTYARYTLLDDSLAEYMPFFAEQEIGVICAAALAMELLTSQGPQSWHPANEEAKEQAQKAINYCKQEGVELARLAIFYTSKLNGPATFLVGMQTRQMLDLNWKSYVCGLTQEEHKVLDYIQANFCKKKFHWEGVELKKNFNR